MVLESDTERCVSLLVVPQRGVDTRRCASKDAGAQREVDLRAVPHRLEEGKSVHEDAGFGRRVDCDVPHWFGRRTNQGVETFL